MVACYGKESLVIVHGAESVGVGSAFDGAAIDARSRQIEHPIVELLGIRLESWLTFGVKSRHLSIQSR
jgi:hypothetical protein